MDRINIFLEIERFISLHREEMIELSDFLGMHPELSEEEYGSSRLFVERLRSFGFDVEYPYMGLPTAFLAKKRSPGASSTAPKVALLAEYDALPDIGHACGHNLHGTMAVYAGIALAHIMDKIEGEVWVVGTPAEETDGAKVLMSEKGVFDEVDLALMFHSYAGESYADYRSLALDGYEFDFEGLASHAAASPWLGRSAQSGMLLFIDAINMLRLHIMDMCRIHAIVRSVSGATNIIPDRAVCRVEVRAVSRKILDEMMDSVFCCADGAAIATKTKVSWNKFMRSFDDMLPNKTAESLAEKILAEHGVVCTRNNLPMGSTDVGNVSYRCPTMQPEFSITDKKIPLHTREFAEATMSPEGHEAL
ncbi:MAG: amidohydrolase, partial [Synergistaceae bacterium]|nr:amidohydrolase [Synergistaceae bacterium]